MPANKYQEGDAVRVIILRDTDTDGDWEPETSPAAGGGGLTDTELRASPVEVDGTVDQGTKNAGGTAAWAVQDDYIGGQVTILQTGADAQLTFTFTSAVNLVVVHAISATTTDYAFANPFGATAAEEQGIPCPNDVPTYMPVVTSTVRVWAPTGMDVYVWGYRRA